jgi:hypothetical protein
LAVASLAAATVVATAGLQQARAITHGDLDGNGHPGVVLVAMYVNGAPAFRCSGTLLDRWDVLTAGHCAGEPGEFSDVFVFTQSDIDGGTAAGTNHYPFCLAGDPCVKASRWASFPGFTEANFALHDVGMIRLSQPIDLPASQYGQLPVAGQLDQYAKGQKPSFTTVGYGAQRSFPDAASWKEQADRVREVAYPKLVQIDTGATGTFSMLLSNNANTGGSCYGDSGGPNFLGSSMTIAGVTSFGRNPTCAGTGGVFRLDKQDVLDFIHGFVAQP